MSPPTVAYVTAGGAGMFCGSCMRDNTLASALLDLGHDVVLVPTFTPIRTEERDVSVDRVFLGGVSIYLDQRWPRLAGLTRALRRGLDHPWLLKWISSLALETRTDDDGALAVSLLQGESGRQRREIDELTRWLADDLRPDLVNLTNLLIAGFVPALKKRLDIPVLVTLQGDDIFLDSLPEGDRLRVIEEMRRLAREVDGFVVFSRYYRDFMSQLLEAPIEQFHLVPMGLASPESFAVGEGESERGRADSSPPVVGYLARICPEKGFHILVDAFLLLRRMPGMENALLRVAGWLGQASRPFFAEQQRKLAHLPGALEHVQVPDRSAKIDFLRGLDVFSVPTVYREPKGIFVLEALAAGVSVVQPEHGAFPELLASTGGGRLVPPNDPEALALVLHALLTNPEERRRLADEGQRKVLKDFSSDWMARQTWDVYQGCWRASIEGASAGCASLTVDGFS